MSPLEPWLSFGSTVAVFAPCGPPHRARTRQGLAWLESRGYRVLLSPLLSRWMEGQANTPLPYLAGTDEERLEDILWALSLPKAQAAWAVRGGYGLTRILDSLDLSQCRPRLVLGFSDLTALLWKLAQADWPQLLHAPNVQSLALAIDGGHSLATLEEILLAGKLPHYRGNLWFPGEARGRLGGGNLCVLASLSGTAWQFATDGLLFLEDVNEAPYRLDRYLTQLRCSGSLARIKGVVLGDFESCGNAEELQQTLRFCLEGWGVPVLAGLPCGHGARNEPLPLGLHAALGADGLYFVDGAL